MASDQSSVRRPPIVRRDSYVQDNRSIGVFTSGGDASGKHGLLFLLDNISYWQNPSPNFSSLVNLLVKN